MIKPQRALPHFSTAAIPVITGYIMSFFILFLNSMAIAQTHPPRELALLRQWSGDYPVSELHRLPEGQRTSAVGFLGDDETFSRVWQAFKPGEKMPALDFKATLAVFSRNVEFYNRTSIVKATLRAGVAHILAIETMSAMPIEDKVAMAIAVIPRAGILSVKAGDSLIPVRQQEAAIDPGNATYTLEGEEIRLVDGRAEREAAPGSATKIITRTFGTAVYGDLDGDSIEDAALFLVHSPGGSGTFYYAAAALNRKGAWQGTNAVLLGDRVSPQTMEIRNGVLAANFADRLPHEAMATPPRIGKTKYLTLQDNELEPVGPLGEGEQVVEGWVTIGHEVRSFRPCSGSKDLWLQGDSPALQEIRSAYADALPQSKPYTPLFMVLAGKYADRPPRGFGMEYDGAFSASRLVKVVQKGNCRSGFIMIDAPLPGELLTSPLTIRGRARGTWFFEGDFPVILKNSQGQAVAESYVTAKGEWMTENFVPFAGTLEFESRLAPEQGTLIFKKDNPTDLPEHDDEMEIPVLYK